jgi:hypothetical protein
VTKNSRPITGTNVPIACAMRSLTAKNVGKEAKHRRNEVAGEYTIYGIRPYIASAHLEMKATAIMGRQP